MSYSENRIPAILTEEFPITSADCDNTRKLKPSALVNMFIQIAWHHAEKLGFGIDFLHEHGLVWMLSRLHLKIEYLPSWSETVCASTWPKGIRRLFYLRDLHFTDKKGSSIAKGTSEWLMIDINARRPKLYQPENNIFRQNLGKNALPGEADVLELPADKPEIYGRMVYYSDIDLNNHLTTIRYIDFMMDTFSSEFLAENPVREIVLNFSREIPEETNLQIRRYNINNRCCLFEFTSPGGTPSYFKGKIAY
jgi:medium-chain acyl-[acyl-carrier-protein] hydrolase